MTEKRFTLNKQFLKDSEVTEYIMIPILDRDKELTVTNVVDLLNELYNENKELKEKLCKIEEITIKLKDE